MKNTLKAISLSALLFTGSASAQYWPGPGYYSPYNQGYYAGQAGALAGMSMGSNIFNNGVALGIASSQPQVVIQQPVQPVQPAQPVPEPVAVPVPVPVPQYYPPTVVMPPNGPAYVNPYIPR